MDARRGGARVGRRPSPPLSKIKKKFFWLYLGPFCYFFFIWGPFCYVFLIFGGLFATFYFMVGAFFGACPPPTKISAGAHDCKEGSKVCMLPGNFFVWPRFSEFCYDFALKMTKIVINCSQVPARWVWRHANSRKMLVNGAIWSVLWYDFSFRKL